MVLHCMIKVNGKTCNISSYVVKEGDKISVKEKYKEIEIVKNAGEEAESIGRPDWLEFEASSFTGTMVRKPTRDEITLVGGDIKESLIVELYSK